jgi:polygalacturonase
MKGFSVTACLAAVTLVGCAQIDAAQDTRTVTEPVVPPVCSQLKAVLVGAKGIALADEEKLDTDRIQKSLDVCGVGTAVELSPDGANNAFLTGPIQLRKGVTLLIDKGVTLYASREPKVYEKGPGSCGLVSDEKPGCITLIIADHANDAAIMGDGTIDGRGGSRLLVDGPNGLKEQKKTWWDLAEDARQGGRQQVPRLIEMDHSDNFTLYNITLKNSPNFHVVYHHGDGLTVWGLKIDTPRTARNTDGIDPSASKNITVTHSYIRTGDDNIAIKGGDGPVTNMTVIHNHFYSGHGMSIGSETKAGVSAIRVTDLSLDGTDAGVRIKSQQAYGGLVHDVIYDDLCIRNSKAPIQLDTNYQANPKPGSGLIPVFQDIVLHNVRISGGGKIQLNGFDHTHRIGIQFNGVMLLDDVTRYKPAITHTDILLGPGPVNLLLLGTDSTVRGTMAPGELPSCEGRFEPFPDGAGSGE